VASPLPEAAIGPPCRSRVCSDGFRLPHKFKSQSFLSHPLRGHAREQIVAGSIEPGHSIAHREPA
jgi:hypothetical protein